MRFRYVIFFIVLFAVACDDVSFSPLIGKWQLKTVERDGEKAVVDTVWYNFQSISIFSVQIYTPQNESYTSFFGLRTQEDKVIHIQLQEERIVGYCSDWNSATRSFTIEKLNKNSLILRSEEGYKYSFIKF